MLLTNHCLDFKSYVLVDVLEILQFITEKEKTVGKKVFLEVVKSAINISNLYIVKSC